MRAAHPPVTISLLEPQIDLHGSNPASRLNDMSAIQLASNSCASEHGFGRSVISTPSFAHVGQRNEIVSAIIKEPSRSRLFIRCDFAYSPSCRLRQPWELPLLSVHVRYRFVLVLVRTNLTHVSASTPLMALVVNRCLHIFAIHAVLG